MHADRASQSFKFSRSEYEAKSHSVVKKTGAMIVAWVNCVGGLFDLVRACTLLKSEIQRQKAHWWRGQSWIETRWT